ncbi:MAG: sugar ABC transporter permease [Thermomicrobiales bacterium]|nr:sugar ABC transporter permease [Thermomicrobiales bacterium]
MTLTGVSETAVRPAAATRSRRLPSGEWLLFLLFVGPNLTLFAIFTYWPMIYSAYLSTVRWNMISPTKRGVGLDNYRYLLNNDTFHTVLLNSVYFTVGAVGGSMLLGLLSALLLNEKLRGRDAARAIVFMPTLLSGAAIGIVWVYIFDPRYGLIATLLDPLHISSPNWLRDTSWAMPAIIIVYVWKNLGFATVIYLAGLQAIPRDLYEAAKVDGAGAFWRFRSVTVPMLSPITFFLVVTSMLNSFQAFDIIQVMTRGGPVDATNNLIYYIYDQGFVAFNAGRSSAAAMILFVVMLAITLIQLKLSERKVHYGA